MRRFCGWMGAAACLALAAAAWAENPPAAAKEPARAMPRGYSVPVVDLDGDAARQIVVDREKGQYLKHNFHAWDCAYPALELLPDGTIVATTYGHWTQDEPPYILSVRFKIEDLDAKAKALKAKP